MMGEQGKSFTFLFFSITDHGKSFVFLLWAGLCMRCLELGLLVPVKPFAFLPLWVPRGYLSAWTQEGESREHKMILWR